MFFLHQPSEDRVGAFLARQGDATFSYPHVGASREGAPAGYNVDRNRIKIGDGAAAYRAGVAALRQWTMFDLGWVKLYKPDTPIEVNATVAVSIGHLGFWSLNAARIVYVIDEDGPDPTFGFAYGTLKDHGERGEERFTVSWCKNDDSVWYELLAFSKPGPAARLAYPCVRRLQRQFARDSMRVMKNAVVVKTAV
jgi:uncharacterized protein (UPF0548 family)